MGILSSQLVGRIGPARLVAEGLGNNSLVLVQELPFSQDSNQNSVAHR